MWFFFFFFKFLLTVVEAVVWPKGVLLQAKVEGGCTGGSSGGPDLQRVSTDQTHKNNPRTVIKKPRTVFVCVEGAEVWLSSSHLAAEPASASVSVIKPSTESTLKIRILQQYSSLGSSTGNIDLWGKGSEFRRVLRHWRQTTVILAFEKDPPYGTASSCLVSFPLLTWHCGRY